MLKNAYSSEEHGAVLTRGFPWAHDGKRDMRRRETDTGADVGLQWSIALGSAEVVAG